MDLRKVLFPYNLEEARKIQLHLLKKLKLCPLKKMPRLIAAVDAAFTKNQVLAAACLFSFPELELLEEQTVSCPLTFPYRTGFLSFLEGPAIYQTLTRFRPVPDLILADGQGIAHPRRMGLATFLGIILNRPSLGCAKSHLVGNYREPARDKGSFSEIWHRGELVGYVLRSRTGVKPIFISPGHLIDHRGSLEVVERCLRGYRIPEPLRRTHQLTQKLRTENL